VRNSSDPLWGVTLRDLKLESSGHRDSDTDTKGLRPVAKDAIRETNMEAYSDAESMCGTAVRPPSSEALWSDVRTRRVWAPQP
jgi:hypothetical protein